MSNSNADGGYEHFHPHGRGAPSHTRDKSDNGALPFKHAPHSGNHNMGQPEGMPPEGLPSMPNVNPVGS